jgi:hypothetical protein
VLIATARSQTSGWETSSSSMAAPGWLITAPR